MSNSATTPITAQLCAWWTRLQSDAVLCRASPGVTFSCEPAGPVSAVCPPVSISRQACAQCSSFRPSGRPSRSHNSCARSRMRCSLSNGRGLCSAAPSPLAAFPPVRRPGFLITSRTNMACLPSRPGGYFCFCDRIAPRPDNVRGKLCGQPRINDFTSAVRRVCARSRCRARHRGGHRRR